MECPKSGLECDRILSFFVSLLFQELFAFLETSEIVLDEERRVKFTHCDFIIN